jgi:tRNA-2-methylthio-N6-dimethylallyladenosine synthase
MNLRDSDAITAILTEKGFKSVEDENEADIIILNTCTVRGKAEDKAIGKMGFLKRLKRKNPDLLLGIMGCAAQRMGDELFEKLPHLDFVVGTEQLHKVPEIIEQELKERQQFIDVTPQDAVLTSMGAHYKPENKISEFVAIMRGCDRFCSYCIVPFVRGREKSREIDDIVQEVNLLAKKGVVEITLLGQNVAAFGFDGVKPPIANDVSPFAELLKEVAKIEEIKRIRFTSPHPAYFNDKLIETIGELDKVCDSLHLPLQSGSNDILKKMNRPYTSEEYLEIVRKLKLAKPNITFSTDIIVGFPGETDADFEETRRVFQEVRYDNAYIFKYSTRRGTLAAKWDDDISKEVKEERNQILLEDLSKITSENHVELMGSIQEILVEGISKRNETRWKGKTSTNQVVIFEPNDSVKVGDLIKIKVNRTTQMTLYGEIV